MSRKFDFDNLVELCRRTHEETQRAAARTVDSADTVCGITAKAKTVNSGKGVFGAKVKGRLKRMGQGALR